MTKYYKEKALLATENKIDSIKRDADFFKRMGSRYDFYAGEETVSKWRVHNNQATQKMKSIIHKEGNQTFIKYFFFEGVNNKARLSRFSDFFSALLRHIFKKSMRGDPGGLKSMTPSLYIKNKKQLLKNKKHYQKIITSLVNKYNWFPSAVHKNKKEYLKMLEKWVLHSKN